jgi:uncharacterized repeat protein (TIGR03803 family)
LLLAWALMPTVAQGQGLTALASFNGTNGDTPAGGATIDANGNLFGTAYLGGTSSNGTVWELAKGASTITALASFNGTNGSLPVASVTFDANGNLFGTAQGGGTSFNGTVWELAKGASTITALASFSGTNGAGPSAGVTFDANGDLFGTAGQGGTSGNGTVWELAKGSSTITALASFNGTSGVGPSGVTFDTNGNLFGTAALGGTSNAGTVWELAKGSSTITALASFNNTNGRFPESGATFDANGNLFGTAAGGGADPNGTVWELAKGSSTITALASFFNLSNGALPSGSVIFDANGNLFGTALLGGANSRGTVWELAKGSSTITALASFNGTNGTNPQGAVTFDANGNLFGAANGGGTSNHGTVWEVSPASASVPEPSPLVLGMISLALAGAVALLKHHRRSFQDPVLKAARSS